MLVTVQLNTSTKPSLPRSFPVIELKTVISPGDPWIATAGMSGAGGVSGITFRESNDSGPAPK
jgi:hypothetical protein